MSKRFLILLPVVVLAALLALLAATSALAEADGAQPGNPLYIYQRLAEQARLEMSFTAQDRALFAITILERRSADLALTANGADNLKQAHYVDLAFGQLLRALAKLRPEQFQSLNQPLLSLVDQTSAAIEKMPDLPAEREIEIQTLRARVNTFRGLVESGPPTGEQLLALARMTSPVQTAAGEKSLQTSSKFQYTHTNFPLTGQHADLACVRCHTNNRFEVMDKSCQSCHSGVRPVDHFPGDCAACHDPTGWKQVAFAHPMPQAADCQLCHIKQRPANHFQGQCSTCHKPEAWKPASFDHAGEAAKDCASCHAPNAPANHYQAQCSACHTTNGWRPVNFNHSAAGATDCRACHGGNAPANHYQAQCSACHATNGWKPANFNHAVAGATDCRACHGGNAPANHFSGQCSSCHSTSTWGGAKFEHKFNMNHEGANGKCALCHPAGPPATDCRACHDNPGGGEGDD